MTPDTFTAHLETLGWPLREMARRLECSPTIVQRWAYGQAVIPQSIAEWVTELAYAVKRLPPPEWRAG
jgi:hypothetical protein